MEYLVVSDIVDILDILDRYISRYYSRGSVERTTTASEPKYLAIGTFAPPDAIHLPAWLKNGGSDQPKPPMILWYFIQNTSNDHVDQDTKIPIQPYTFTSPRVLKVPT